MPCAFADHAGEGYLYAPGVKAGYYPTQRLLHVARDICSEDPLALLFQPLLTALRDATDETAALATLAGNRVVYLDVMESRQKIRYSDEPGGFMYVHASAAGKALLGALGPQARQKLLDSCEPFAGVDRWHDDRPRVARSGGGRWGQARLASLDWRKCRGCRGPCAWFFHSCEAFALVIGGPKARLLRQETRAVAALLEVFRQIPPELVSND